MRRFILAVVLLLPLSARAEHKEPLPSYPNPPGYVPRAADENYQLPQSHPKLGLFKSRLRDKAAAHRYEPDGVPRPIGAGNAYTEFKYVFGSARQFFGTGDASEGHWHRTYVPGPNRYGDR